jgi:hypothetical protein
MTAQPLSDLFDRLEADAQQRLSRNLADIEAGKEDDIVTPFMKGRDDGYILNSFEEEVFNPNQGLLNGTLSEIEENQKSKFGSRSIQKPWSVRKESIHAMFSLGKIPPDFDNPIDLPGKGQLRPQSLERVYGAMKRTTSAGLPYLIRKGEVLDRQLPIEETEWPCVLYTRTQEGGKTRDVWGYPMYALSVEGKYFLPYFELFRHHPVLVAYSGPDAVDEAISKILYTKESDHVLYSEDFESFDQSIHPDFSDRIFRFIAEWFQGDEADTISDVLHRFTNIGICTPDGVFSGSHGIPSGSWFTSVVGSYVHLVAQDAVSKIHENRNQVMGDDGVICLPPSIDKGYISDVYSEFNLVLNEDKTFESRDEVIYLQRYYCSDYKVGGIYRGIYPVYRALNRLIHMERWTNIEAIRGADYFSIRAIAILENCKWHPMHSEFVKWVFRNDKYGLEYSSEGLREYVRKFQAKIQTDVKNQYSDDLSGIEDFETVRILKTL